MARVLGLGISSGVTRQGPSGQKESKDFPRLHSTASPLLLPVPRAHVVGASVSEHEIQGVVTGHVFASPPDHDSKLAFIVDLLTGQMSRNENRIAWILERVESLDEENRKFWNFRFGFLGVPAVVRD